MDHTGENRHGDGENVPGTEADSGAETPVESGNRSQALLAELAEAERARVRAEARVSQLVVDIDQARLARPATTRIPGP